MKQIIHVTYISIIVVLSILLYQNKVKIKELQNTTGNNSDIIYKAIGVSADKQIKLGEEFIAKVFLTEINCNDLPTVMATDSFDITNTDISMYKDTILFDQSTFSHTYRCSPKELGEHRWGVLMSKIIDGEERFFGFSDTYVVEK